MATIWMTYAWKDNTQNDVDFIAQELQTSGLSVKLDRWNISAGKRLWDQIAAFIADPQQSDAWLLLATQHSLESEPCREEYAYALDRALSTRGAQFPVIALFLARVDESLIPAGIKTRLYVSVTDPDWKERIVAAAEGRQHRPTPCTVQPYHAHIHAPQGGCRQYAVEVRPRAGVWAPFFAAVLADEKGVVNPRIMKGPRGQPTGTGVLENYGEGISVDGKWWVLYAGNEATPTTSYYVWCDHLPSMLKFGVYRSATAFVMHPRLP